MTETVIRLDARESAAAENFERLILTSGSHLRLEMEGENAPLWNRRALMLRQELFSGGVSPVNDRYWREQRNIAVHVTDRDEVVIDGGGITLMCDGLMQPLAFWNCDRVTIKN